MGNKCLNQSALERSSFLNEKEFKASTDLINTRRQSKEHHSFNASLKTIDESIVQKDGTRYKGQLLNGKKQGQGKLIFQNGFVLQGKFENDEIVGDVVYQDYDDYRYEGQWKNGQPNGKGKESISSNCYYEGQFKDGIKHGKGFYQWEDLSSYNGDWINNQISGYVKQKGYIYLAKWSQILRQLERKLKTWLWRNVLPQRF